MTTKNSEKQATEKVQAHPTPAKANGKAQTANGKAPRSAQNGSRGHQQAKTARKATKRVRKAPFTVGVGVRTKEGKYGWTKTDFPTLAEALKHASILAEKMTENDSIREVLIVSRPDVA